jgi:AcrR family transcriptional regulator
MSSLGIGIEKIGSMDAIDDSVERADLSVVDGGDECGPQPPAGGLELPVVGQVPVERADARRNRVRILEAADRLFTQRGVQNVSMDAIATEAGVGKGTLFRRFGDRPGLARAMLEARETRMQDRMIRGTPPLGPGAPPRDRLVAFGEARIELLEWHGDIVLAAESGLPGTRYGGPYAVHHAHLASLLGEVMAPEEADYAADTLLGCLSAEHHTFLRHVRGQDLDTVKAGYTALVDRLVG